MASSLFLIPASLAMIGIDSWAWTQASVTAEEWRKIPDWYQLYKRSWRLKTLLPRYVPLLAVVVLAWTSSSDPEDRDLLLGGAIIELAIYFGVFAYVFTKELKDHTESLSSEPTKRC